MAQRYDTYKDSGVRWLGEIPRHWRCVLVHRLFFIKAGGDVKPEFFSDKKDDSHPYPVYTNTKSANDIYAYTSLATCPGNSITVTGRGEIGHAIYREKPYDAIIRLLSLSPKKTNIACKFYAYFIDTVIPFTSDSAAIGQLSAIQIKTKYITLPPLSEQHSIVSYLDDKCGKIDKMLEGKQKQIELLAEMKQRIIADAVTHGINLDVELKESGIFWIRHVPSHWNVRRLGHVLRKENRERPINAELLVCTNKAKVIKRGESKMGLIADSEDVYQGVKKGDLLIHGMDTWHGAIAISEYDGMCTPVVHVCTSNEDVGFISLYLRYMAMMKVFKLISNGVRQNTSDFRSWGKVAVIPCPLPPLDEQHAIVSYITDKTSKIDTLTSKLQQEIESIKEYKQRLISDVVTGQIKVC